MHKFSTFIFLYVFVCCNGRLMNIFKIKEDEEFLQLFQRNDNQEVNILEPECTYIGNQRLEEMKGAIFQRKEFLMYDYIVIRNLKFSYNSSLEVYSDSGKNESSFLILIFYIGDISAIPDGYDFPYEVYLILKKAEVKKGGNCGQNGYELYMLKNVEFQNPDDLELLEKPIKVTMGKAPGFIRINLTPFFENGKWKIYSRDRIAFLIRSTINCHIVLENKLNKPLLTIEKKDSLFSEWGKWSRCIMSCKSPDNIKIRKRLCLKPDQSCYKIDLKETTPCTDPLPECIISNKNEDFSILKVITFVLPVIIVITILIILYNVFYKKKGAERELYENVAGRFMYD